MEQTIGFSVIIPLFNEADNVGVFHKEIVSVLEGYNYELIYINDGSTDDTYNALSKAVEVCPTPHVKMINLAKNRGQSYSYRKGIDQAESSVIVFIDGDLQNDPKDIPKFVSKISEGYDLVQGVRLRRKDAFFTKVVTARIANILLRIFCSSQFTDIGCSLKAFRKEFTQSLNFHSGIHRLLPLYIQKKDAKVAEIGVEHRKRRFGRSKYGLSRVFSILVEIIRMSSLSTD